MGQRLGTPISGNLINCTGYVITPSNITGLGTGVATFLATPSSANLRSALTDETGTGAAVFATSPTLVTPALGTPASGDLSNCTGVAKLTNATLTATPSNPTGTTSGSNVMMGLGVSSCRITTTYGTRLEVTFDGAVVNSSVGQITNVQIRYGTGSGPANADGATGTQSGAQTSYGNGGAVYQGGFSKKVIITGLSPATTYWFDLALSVSGGTGSVLGITFTAMEH